MHFYKDDNGRFKYLSEEGYHQVKDELPYLCFATKYHIDNIESYNWPVIDDSKFYHSKVASKYFPKYICKAGFDHKIDPIIRTDEAGIFSHEDYDLQPLVFYRIGTCIKSFSELPYLTFNKLFSIRKRAQVRFSICPDYTSKVSEKVIQLQKYKYELTKKAIQEFDESLDQDLISAIDDRDYDLLNNPDQNISVADLSFSKPLLKDMDVVILQKRIDAYLMFNKLAIKMLPYILMHRIGIEEMFGDEVHPDLQLLSELFFKSKSLIFRSLKDRYIKDVTETLPQQAGQPGMNLDRGLVLHKKDKGIVDNEGEWTTFSEVMKICAANKYRNMFLPHSNTKAWSVNMLGEGSADAGGPYRDSICNLTDELYHKCLPLLIPTQNNKNNHGLYRDCWTLNPNSTTQKHLEMFKFLGALMGMAFRSGSVIDLKFPPIIWKRLINEPLTKEDLLGFDQYAGQTIDMLVENKLKYDKETFDAAMDLTFTAQLSNGESVPLCLDGELRKVTYDNVEEYIKLVQDTRFREAGLQLHSVKEGFDIVFPIGMLGLLTWKNVEHRVRGPDEILTEDLKNGMSYQSCDEGNEYVQRFWRVFETFTQEERSIFLKFVWGRSRLPPKERLGDQHFILYLMYDDGSGNHDEKLPTSHTCFFQIDLPRYTDDEICKKKILYACEACGEIDTDNTAAGIADAGGVFD